MARAGNSTAGWLHRAKDTALTGVFLLVIGPLLLIPTDWAMAVAGRVGRLVLPLLPARRRIVNNLALVRPDLDADAVHRITADVGETFARTMMEYIRMPSLVGRSDHRDVHGLEHLKEAVAAGRGCVIASAHIGSWEQIRLAAGDAGIEVGLIYHAFNNASFDRVSRLRIAAAGTPVLHKGRNGMREMLALLRRGGAILVLMDQHISGGTRLPFMGHPAVTVTAIPALCRRSGAALIPARALRLQDPSRYDVRFEAPVAPAPPEVMSAEINERIEAWVAEAPGQWFWLHRRWR